MRRLFALAGRSPTIASHAVVSMFAAVLAVWFNFAAYNLLVASRPTIDFDLAFELWLLSSFGLACYLWMSLHAFGFVGEGSGAGFRLALLGLAARIEVSMCVIMTGGEAAGSIYDGLPTAAGPIWWVRNLSLVSFGCGIALVVLASGADLVRRRRGPLWVRAAD